jgi:hypothetical protein
MSRVSLADYWVSYEKQTPSFGLEDSCNVFLHYDCERKAQCN